MLLSKKLIAKKNLRLYREKLRASKKTLVLTNGCFDLLHAGHVYALQEAAQQADVLWVGINSDNGVRQLKGNNRPIYPQEARIYLLNALECVQGLFVFDGCDLADEITQIQPDVYVKSGDYTLDKLNRKERLALEACHAKIMFLPFLEGWSTTNIVKVIQQ